jgi:hypothetical protein
VDLVHLTLNDLHYYHYGPSGPPYYLSSYLTITLIPKEKVAKTLDRYIPIALCNVVYKIISKVIENRLKPLLYTLVSQEKEGFMEGTQIMDNIIHAHELIHILKLQKI